GVIRVRAGSPFVAVTLHGRRSPPDRPEKPGNGKRETGNGTPGEAQAGRTRPAVGGSVTHVSRFPFPAGPEGTGGAHASRIPHPASRSRRRSPPAPRSVERAPCARP